MKQTAHRENLSHLRVGLSGRALPPAHSTSRPGPFGLVSWADDRSAVWLPMTPELMQARATRVTRKAPAATLAGERWRDGGMLKLLVGLALFFSLHLVPTRPPLRARLVAGLGTTGYAGLFSLLSLGSLVLIFLGYGELQGLARANPQLWVPPTWTRHVAMLLMIPAMILLVAAYVPSRIRTAARHPMLAAVKLWALSHLLANGDLASVLLFGSFLAYAVYDRISVKQRGAAGPLGTAQGGPAHDAIVVVGGLALYALLLVWGHGKLTGVPLLS
jgi:uncharacterized membrane protein